jgi:hypothetical protein
MDSSSPQENASTHVHRHERRDTRTAVKVATRSTRTMRDTARNLLRHRDRGGVSSAAAVLALFASVVLCADDAPPLPADAQKLIDVAGSQELLLQQELKTTIANLRQALVTTLQHADEQARQQLDLDRTALIQDQIEALQGKKPSAPPSPSATSHIGTGPVAIAIACAGTAVGAFLADQAFTGGNDAHYSGAVRTSSIAHAAPEGVYLNERYGVDMAYSIPGLVPGASYVVRLHFSENYFADPGQRVFDILINGEVVLKHLDIIVAAGGPRIALVRDFTAKATATGRLAISFAAVVQNPKLCGLEIIRAAP